MLPSHLTTGTPGLQIILSPFKSSPLPKAGFSVTSLAVLKLSLIDQAGIELTEFACFSLLSAGLKVCTTLPVFLKSFYNKICFILFFHDRFKIGFLSVNIPGCPRTCFVDQLGLELMEINLPLPPKSGTKGMCYLA